VSEWAYVAIAYTIVWGALAVYAVVLARRVAQAERVAKTMRVPHPDETLES
jgi:CcmD family protein